jgi:hypothetical protein
MAFDILKIGDYLACPFRIMDHATTCLFYWGLDWLFHLIWCIVWVLVFIFVFCPIWLALAMLCLCVGKIAGCYTVSVDDICPSWSDFANFIENIAQTLTGSRFLYRDDGDMHNCYCVDPLPEIFDPFRNYSSYYGSSSDASGPSKGTLLVPMIVFGLLYSYNRK